MVDEISPDDMWLVEEKEAFDMQRTNAIRSLAPWLTKHS
jgi:hypothetical protein